MMALIYIRMKSIIKKIRMKRIMEAIFNVVMGKDPLDDSDLMQKKEMEMEEKVRRAYQKRLVVENENYPLKLLEMFSFHSIGLLYKLHPRKTLFDKLLRFFFYVFKSVPIFISC